eukprot:scaffold42963_cov22-Prasinocladus_malaysianus.AAC.1
MNRYSAVFTVHFNPTGRYARTSEHSTGMSVAIVVSWTRVWVTRELRVIRCTSTSSARCDQRALYRCQTFGGKLMMNNRKMRGNW